ncbi:hypothetical protein ABWH74_002892 [Burkholderia vietnamiensis]|nr:hypothetical protein [Burkholderia vietnamiensis]MBR8015330.1 hypothetical protein [Burkholderia vietnamiensis]MBR8053972.1 hypothetical protein [Burkholderia vietnamiensis]MBR8278899.1 hypothetical protein [Burkholderia vietnamiensis]MCA7987683.1 hypothetical protein [Burkholderia vietnamiensis]MCA8193604.1 hypothetical protein [Burkholderia vietnamiensis]
MRHHAATMPHRDLQEKRIIFIVTINFIDDNAENPCRSVVRTAAFNRLTV